MLPFLRLALKHHRTAALVCALLAVVSGLTASTAVPDLYYVEAMVYVAEPVTVHRLANPFSPVPQSRRELSDVPEVLLSREKLVALVKRSGLLEQWERGRPWPQKLKDRLMEKVRGPIAEKDRLEALVAIVERRVNVEVDGQRVFVSAEWTDPDVAKLLVKTQMSALMRLRTQREAKTMEEAAHSLDEQLAGVQAEMSARLEKIERASNTADGWATVEVEMEQLLRDQSRAADLLVQSEERHIGAEVFRTSNSLRFTVVHPPRAPRAPNGLGLVARLLVLGLATALVAAVCAAALGLLSRRVLSAAQLTHETGLQVLAELRVPHASLIVSTPRWALALSAGLSLATGVAWAATRGNPLLSLLPPLGAVALWLVWTRPLKWPFLLTCLLAVTVDDSSDRPYVGLWQSPLWALGKVVYRNIALFTGFELVLLGLGALMVFRRVWLTHKERAALDPIEHPAPRPLQHVLVLSFLTIGWLVLMGVARGGVFREALWQFRALLFLPVAALVAMYALDLPKDLPKLFGVLVIGSVMKALHGAYFIYFIATPMGEYPPHTTGHNDTMIFVVAVIAMLLMMWERPVRRHFWLVVGWLPLVFLALKLNDRRIAYVDIVMALGAVFLLSPMHRSKRWLTRMMIFSLPLFVVYVGVGWNKTGGAFAPVAKVRSIIAPAEESEEESSNVERDIENYNLMRSWEANMFLGQGFGHAFKEFVPSNDFRQSNFGHVGHNSILWVWWIGGLTGFTGVLLWVAAAVYFLGRTLRVATDWQERVALFVSLGIIMTYLMQAFGDMGTQSIMFDLFCGVACAIVGRLASKHQVWRPTPEPVSVTDPSTLPALPA